MIIAVSAVPRTVPVMPKREVKNAAKAAAKPAATTPVSLTAGCLSLRLVGSGRSPSLSVVCSSSLLVSVMERTLPTELAVMYRIHISTAMRQEVTRAIKDYYQSVTSELARTPYPVEPQLLRLWL
jgi:hypothetical protein